MLTHTIIVFTLVVLPLAAFEGPVDCTDEVRNTVGCPTVTGTVNPDDVTLNGSGSAGGGNGGGQDPGSGNGGDASGAPGDAPVDPLADCADPRSEVCVRPFIATVTAPVTLIDIAAFRPAPAVDHMEPGGWTVAGLDTNFYATGGTEIVDGNLLGQPASVRFTPRTWRWEYGDGAAASHPFPGSSWAAQGVAEFDRTGTSHVYETYGNYTIDLAVGYSAEYRFAGGPWVPIAGMLTVPANPLTISVGDAKTVLVQRECTRNPAGPGC